MAKGDVSAQPAVAGAQPKIDQYSVMHKIMDALGGNQAAQNIAPSPDMAMPNPTMMGGTPPSIGMSQGFKNPYLGGNNSGVVGPAPMGGRFGGGMGMPRSGDIGMGVPQTPTIGPSNPQDTLRRGMIGARTFGGV